MGAQSGASSDSRKWRKRSIEEEAEHFSAFVLAAN
jgi:hypothetical protein